MEQLLSEYDVVIIGSGIAGLYTALKLDSNKSILVLSKDHIKNSNTNLAQGGIAVTFNKNDFESHINDTLKTGYYYNDEDRLRMMVEEGGKSINTLIDWGVNFDSNDDGTLLLTKEGGHSLRRIIHYKDTTGEEIIRGMLNSVASRNNITLVSHVFAVDLIVTGEGVVGIKVAQDRCIKPIYANQVVIATGGIGELYKNTTNASIATGDGIAMAVRSGVSVKDMEFVQFHPTALNAPGHSHFLISEAVRGEGGILRNETGDAFMNGYHPLKDLAPRSVVSKAIFEEANKQGNDKIYLDVTHLAEEYIKNRFPNIYNECLSRGIDIVNEWIPIIPVQHYMMGGIETDAIGRTNLDGLYACGEVACTGVHGANRMASNSLLEGAVFAFRVAEDINASHRKIKSYEKNLSYVKDENNIKIHAYKNQLQEIMSDYVFIFRNKSHLIKALKLVDDLSDILPDECTSQEGYELRNMVLVSKLIIKAAIDRDDTLGSHIIEGEN